MTDLSDLVNEANREREWSTREIAAQANRLGCKLSHATAGKILNGSHGLISLDTIYALEAVFKLNRDDITSAAKLPPVSEMYRPPIEAAHLTRRQRKAINALILSIVDRGGVAGDDASSDPPQPDADPIDPYTQAARELAELDQEPPTPSSEKGGEHGVGA